MVLSERYGSIAATVAYLFVFFLSSTRNGEIKLYIYQRPDGLEIGIRGVCDGIDIHIVSGFKKIKPGTV